jgi:hypothetical protein
MVVLETLFLGNDSGSLVNAAQSLPAWRRLITPGIEATVPGFQGFHIIGGGVRAGNAAPLPEPEKCPPWKPGTVASIRRQAW